MQTLRYRLDTTADGSNQDWSVLYSTYGYEAVDRSSADTTYIQSATLNDRSDFDCGDGPHPELGFVSGLTLHYRVKSTDTTGSPVVAIDVSRGGTPLSIGLSVAPVTASGWTDGEYRISSDPVTSARFAPGSLDDLGVLVQVTTAPTNGVLQVGRLWLEVEWTLSPESYDPVYQSVVPDSVVGQMDWSTTGTQTAAIAGDQLVLTDGSGSDHRAYSRTILEYGVNHITEVATRFNLTSSNTGFNYRAALVDDATAGVDLCCFTDSLGATHIGLTTVGTDHDDPDAYFASYAVDWTESHHYRLLIDRQLDPGDSFNVRVYVDYADAPAMEVNYYKFDATSSASIEFGTGDSTLQTAVVTAYVDFIDWWHYEKSGQNWRYWYANAIGDNTVEINSTDADIVQPVTITPPGITTGQSRYCAKMTIAGSSLTDECSVRTYWSVPAVFGLYDVTLDYKMAANVEDAVLQVQRTSDYYYWNEGGSTWQSTATNVTVPYSATRTRVTLMSDVQTPAPDELAIKVMNDTSASLTYEVYLYKVDVRD